MPEQHQVHGAHRAEHRFHGNPDVAAVQRRRSEQSQPEAPGVAAQGEIAIFAVQAGENVAVAIEKSLSQIEELHFLGVIFARQHRLQINLHARLRRAPAEQPECLAGKFRLREERRQSGQHQQQHRPGREAIQQSTEGNERDGILTQCEGAHDEAQRTAGGFAARPRQLVIEFRILELRQIQRQRLFQDHDVDALTQLRAQQRLRE